MNLREAELALNELERQLYVYNHAIGIVRYDGETVAPRNSAPARGRTLGELSGIVQRLMTSESTGEILSTILAAGDAADRRLRRRAEVLSEERELLVIMPPEEYIAYETLLGEAGAVWREAKWRNDYAAFAPYLEKIVAYNRRLAERRDSAKPPYDALLDLYEKGTTIESLDPFFERLRADLTPVVLEIGKRPQPDDSMLRRGFPIEKQRAFTDRLMEIMGINRADCAVGETEHPFTDGVNKHDIRITTHYHEDNVASSMFSVIHEGGHALYELAVADDLQETCLGGGSSMGLHESQSRFYENLIGRSRPFAGVLLKALRELFPGKLDDVDAEQFYRAINRAEPSLIRTEADELTYPMHVNVRYEMEKRMLDGSLSVADIPGEWNRLYRDLLGVEVPDDRRGCLQDSHWSSGLLGYFPSYALGSAYGAQMLRVMEKDINVWTYVAAGDLRPVTAWLGERIHRYGKLLTPAELLQNALGQPFDPGCYTAYLREKYTELYNL